MAQFSCKQSVPKTLWNIKGNRAKGKSKEARDINLALDNINEDFRSQFNSDWAGKLLIVVDEVLLNRREDSERLKNLSTTLSYKVEAKGKDRDEIGRTTMQGRPLRKSRPSAYLHCRTTVCASETR